MRENRFNDRKQPVGRSPRHRRQWRERTDPIGDADAVQEHRRPGQPLRRRRGGMTARGQDSADPGHRQGRQAPRATLPDALRLAQRGPRPSPPSLSAATARGWWRAAAFHGADVAIRRAARSSTSRPCKPQRSRGAEETDDQGRRRSHSKPARPGAIQAAKKAPPTPMNSPR